MISQTFRLILCIVFVSFAGAVSSQESESDAASDVDNNDALPASLEKCFNVPGFRDMNVISDQHVYIRTRGSNHYLVTTEECRNLQRSYRVGEVHLVPYGRSVCQNDGSYLLYNNGGRATPCPILTIERVDDRTQARSIAEGDRPMVEIKEIDPAN